MSLVPNHRERQFMQQLRGRGWVELPENPITLQRLLAKRWIESQRMERDIAYRITDEGMAAKKAPVACKV
jgi:hypothetical protein